MKRRFGWEFNGVRQHEPYFENFVKRLDSLRKKSALYEKLWQDFGPHSTWERGFMGAAACRGIGWLVPTCDPLTGRLFNV
ncbi:MAG: superoxide dismutase [Nitrospira sp.]|nr:MAG: superoxide dismutase [Nitrospira sp.]